MRPVVLRASTCEFLAGSTRGEYQFQTETPCKTERTNTAELLPPCLPAGVGVEDLG